MQIKFHGISPAPTASPRPDWLLFFVLLAMAIVGSSSFVIGYVLIAAAP